MSPAERLAQRRQLLLLDSSLARWRLVAGVRNLAHEADPRVLAGRAFGRMRQHPATLLPLLFKLASLLYKRRRR